MEVILLERVEKLGDGPFLVDRHQPVAHLIGGSVEADGQHAADLFGGARNLGHDATGRERDPPTR